MLERTGDASNAQLFVHPKPKYTVELNSLFVLLPQHCARLILGSDSKSVIESRQRLGQTLGNVGHEWEAIVVAATEVFHKKKLRHVATEAEFLAELDRIRPFHLAAQLAVS